MKSLLLPLIFLMIANCNKETPKPVTNVTGKVIRLDVPSENSILSRPVDVWLPPGYDSTADRRYPVLYMHDGQNLFDPSLSFIGVDWDVDGMLTRLISEGKTEPVIVVGVWNSPERVNDYMPQKPVEKLDKSSLSSSFNRYINNIKSDDYLKYLVNTLKPAIDKRFKTKPEREHTAVMGSSMGGLISLYAVCEYPDVFGSAGCVSTHWPAGEGIVVDYLRENLPAPGKHRWYFDFGTATLDSLYEPYQIKADQVMKAAGYTEGSDWITLKFEGDEHSERAWSKRLNKPLEFLFSPSANQD